MSFATVNPDGRSRHRHARRQSRTAAYHNMIVSDSVDRVFVHALNTVKRIPRAGTVRPPVEERLKLYGLYKQSMEGDVEGIMDRPVGNTADVYAECEKWDAWYAQRGLSRTEAKRRYITTLINTMHRYASQTPDALELVAELEFVWDQVKSNTAPSSASSSPTHQSVGVPPLLSPEQSYRKNSIGGQLNYEGSGMAMVNTEGRKSRLRVLSPVSQQDVQHQHSMQMQNEEEEELEEESEQVDYDDEDGDEEEAFDEEDEYEEAQDGNSDENNISDEEAVLRQKQKQKQKQKRKRKTLGQDEDGGGSTQDHNNNNHNKQLQPRLWRRRVEQALTKMTAEVAAVREQMEARTLAHRRKTGLWAWLKWLVWVALRQIIWDVAMLGVILIWMRAKGDRRLEEKLRNGWMEVKARLSKLKILRRIPLPP